MCTVGRGDGVDGGSGASPRTAHAEPDTLIEYVALAGPCAAEAPVTEHSATATYAAADTVIEYVAPTGTCAAPAPVSECAPTAAYAANDAGCDEDASPKSTHGLLETMHTDVAASNSSSMATVELGQETSDGEDSESDAPCTPELDNVLDVLVELAGGYRRQIQAQTSLQLERVEKLLEEWECMGAATRGGILLVGYGSSRGRVFTLVCFAQIE